ncbi:MAG: 2'-5' RNA ligase family protein [Myxococcota bacterium]
MGPSVGTREAWRRGRKQYAVWLFRVRSAAVQQRARDVIAALGDTIRPTPLDDLHVTLFVAGFPTDHPQLDDDVAEATLHEQRRALASAQFSGFTLTIGSANAFASAPFLEVQGDIEPIRQVLIAASSQPEIRFSDYRPHLTLGVFQDSGPIWPVQQTLARFRTASPIHVGIGGIELVTFDARIAGSRLETRWTITAPFDPR